jgi:hypothetical protein
VLGVPATSGGGYVRDGVAGSREVNRTSFAAILRAKSRRSVGLIDVIGFDGLASTTRVGVGMPLTVDRHKCAQRGQIATPIGPWPTVMGAETLPVAVVINDTVPRSVRLPELVT